MRAVLIDDEKPALAQIEWLLERDGRLEVAAKFTSAREGINYLSENHADIVFLDIEMPGVNGLEAAEQLRQFRADIRIVYITAYSEYAIEAFDLHALDYLLKPVHPDRFKKTVTRILEDLERIRSAPEKTAPPPLVKTFTRLGIYDGGSGTSLRQFRVLRTLKAQELFAYFIHRKEQWISKDQLMEILWPGVRRIRAGQLSVDRRRLSRRSRAVRARGGTSEGSIGCGQGERPARAGLVHRGIPGGARLRVGGLAPG
jgi:two-component SAPR family response regulator